MRNPYNLNTVPAFTEVCSHFDIQNVKSLSMKIKLPALVFFFLTPSLISCVTPPTNYVGQYPDDIRKIIENKCSISGCHNDQSFKNAANINFSSWADIWKGGSSGSFIVPYNPENSSLMFFINTDSSKGPMLQPRMPLNNGALSASEYETIKSWIAMGAPDKTGRIPFADQSSSRQKVYITQQGCDLMGVIDAKTGLIMRYVSVGMENGIEVPHFVRFSPDGKYAYVSFTSGSYVQKIDAATDAVIGSAYLGDGSWNLFQVSPNGRRMLISDLSSSGKIKFLDLDSMKVLYTYEDFINPHGIAGNYNFDTFWVTSQYGNTIYRLTLKGGVRSFSIDDEEKHFRVQTRDPHEIIMSPDYSKYFISCQASNEIRVMDTRTNRLLKAIPVGTYPQTMAISQAKPYLFVTCQEEVTPEFPKFLGAVYVIDYNTLDLVKRIPGPFYQAHGIAVDDRNMQLFVSSRNLSVTGPAPHHTSECGGRNGYYNIYDLNTLELLVTKRFENNVDPYSADTRFK